jgi:hypothetical protein
VREKWYQRGRGKKELLIFVKAQNPGYRGAGCIMSFTFVLSVGAITFSALIAVNYQIFPLDFEKLLNVIFAGMIPLFSAKEASLRYMRAYHRLRVALAKFDSEEDYPKFGLGLGLR